MQQLIMTVHEVVHILKLTEQRMDAKTLERMFDKDVLYAAHSVAGHMFTMLSNTEAGISYDVIRSQDLLDAAEAFLEAVESAVSQLSKVWQCHCTSYEPFIN